MFPNYYSSKNTTISTATLREEVKTEILEKNVFEYKSLSKLIAIWHSQTIIIPMQLPKSFSWKSNTPPKKKVWEKALKKEKTSIKIEKCELVRWESVKSNGSALEFSSKQKSKIRNVINQLSVPKFFYD